jgi:hypothetical protein
MAESKTSPGSLPPLNPIKPVVFDKPEYDAYVNELSDAPEGPSAAIAKTLADGLSQSNPGVFSYDTLRDGTALFFDYSEQTRELPASQRALTDNQIITLFARGPEGEKIESGTFSGGFIRDLLPSVVSSGAFLRGAQAGNLAVSAIPPVTPITAGIRLLVPVLAGLGAATFGDWLTRKAQDNLVGEEPLLVPGTAAAFEAGKTAAGAVGALYTPFLLKNVNLGAKAVVSNIQAGAKPTLSTRAVAGIENSLNRTGEVFRGGSGRWAQGAAVLGEAGAGAGQALGTYAVEQIAPGSENLRLGAELAGGVVGGTLTETLTQRAPQFIGNVYTGVRDRLRRFKADNAANASGTLTETQKMEAADYLLRQLEANQEDPEEIIKLLNSDSFSEFLQDAEGNPIKLTPAQLTGSPTLLRLQMERASSGGAPEIASESKKAIDAIRRGILFMYANGDRESLGDLAKIQTGLWDVELSNRLENATLRVQDSMERVGKDVDSMDSADRLIKAISEQESAMRAQEKALWSRVPKNLEITEFLDEAGNPTDTPNLIRAWEALLPTVPEAKDAITEVSELRNINNFVNRKKEELGLTGDGAGADGAPAPRVLPEQKRANDALNKIQGTEFESPFNSVLSSISDLPVEDQVKRLRQEATTARTTTPTARSREYANALDKQADLLVAEVQQPVMDGTPAPSGTLTLTEVLSMRNLALTAGRELAAAGKADKARIAYTFADAALEDLDSFPDGTSSLYDNARAYSRALNDVFTRAYAADVLGTKRTGAPSIPVNVLATRLFKGDAGYLRAQELDLISQVQFKTAMTTLLESGDRPTGQALLESATKRGVVNPRNDMINRQAFNSWFDQNEDAINSIPGLRENLTNIITANADIRGASEELLRSARSAALDPRSKNLNVDALRRWMKEPNNARLLAAMPALKSDLDDVQIARQLLTRETDVVSEQAAERKAGLLSLYELLPDKTLNPATQVSLAISLTNPKPFTELNSLWSYIDQIGKDGFTVASGPNRGKTYSKQELVNGFRSALMDSVFNRTGESGPVFNISTAVETLFKPHPNSPNKLTLAEWMTSKGIMDEAQMGRTKDLLTRMAQIQIFAAKSKPGDIQAFEQEVGPLFSLVTRLSGSEAGSRMQRMLGGTGNSLIAGSAGSMLTQKMANTYLAKLPASLKMDIIQTVSQDPKLLADVLRRGQSEEQKITLIQELVKAFVDNGIMSSIRRAPPVLQTYISDEEEADLTAPPPAAPEPQALPTLPPQEAPVPTAPPPTQGVGAAPSPVPLSSAVPQRPPIQSSGPVDRARFAALFPEDRELLGIGSLMQG